MSLLNHLPPFILGLIEPGILLYLAIRAYTTLLLQGLLQNGHPPPSLRSKAFGKFWERISPVPDPAAPLIGSATLVPPLLTNATGTVLDVGPGNGSLIARFTPAAPHITHIYGAEPATALHKTLRTNADASDLGRKYEILAADATFPSIARELVRVGAITAPDDARGTFDTIVCVRVLCSVPDLRGTISDLYRLLKPGGKLLVCEHTANPWRTSKGSVIARAMQTVYMLMGWSYFVGDCELTRDIEDELRRDARGRWESVDVERHFGRAVFTYVSGVLVKKGR
ncbi:hypothetical protein LTR70_001730 [Exophiala xenobiotica]|nr:hypothetical protein LTR70_001730 [Exophiala xenobiotica]